MTTKAPATPPSTLVADLQDLVRRHYVIESDIDAIVRSVADLGTLSDRPPQEVAETLTTALQQPNGDRHLRVRFRPDGAASGYDSEHHVARYTREALRNAGGIATVGRVADGVGLLAVAPYLSPVDLAAPYVAAAFRLLQGVDALVVDLRRGLGGTPETVALLCSHLLGPEPVHLQDIVSRDEPTRPYWTLPTADRLDDAPVVVLTSARTFSGCEELAYDLQALGRARVVGERTGGGAHPVEAYALDGTLEATIPVAASVNAVTGTNWEQVGVVPDVDCAAEDAMTVALEALASPAD